MSKVAILDIGTYSIHLILADIRPDRSITIIDRMKDPTRLGDGTFATRRISEVAFQRGIEVIHRFGTLARHKDFRRIVATATSAVREAENGGLFIKAIAKHTGIRVQVITGEEEARLIYLGVRQALSLPPKRSLIIDIGGGSVEVVSCTPQRLLAAASLKLGSIRLKEMLVTMSRTSNYPMAALEYLIDQELRILSRKRFRESVTQVIGTSGMIGNLVEMIYWQRMGKPLANPNLVTITVEDIRTVERLLRNGNPAARHTLLGRDPNRADTLYPAALVLRKFLETVGQDRLTFCTHGLKEGLLYDVLQRHRGILSAEEIWPDAKERQIRLLAQRYRVPQPHSEHVARLASQLFDQTQPLHGLGAQERQWLVFAGLLHDVGYVIHSHRHHKHSYYLIRHAELSGLTDEEIAVIANVARYHRRALPHRRHLAFRELSRDRQWVVKVLSALLRIADGLDRTHFSIVKEVTVTVGHTVVVHAICRDDAELELWSAQERADLFEMIFHRPLRLVAVSTNGAPS
ncbi:MAG: Ppx/GppA family phosphatase [Nitrospirae bacterium]|nr:MAG: Ppx/GppA family phosphatase [Nitrospirota bacterium]